MDENRFDKINVLIDTSHWDMMKEFDLGMYEKMMAYREHIFEMLEMDKKRIELILLGMCCIMRSQEAIRLHAERALNFGATKKEIFEVVARSLTTGGIPSYRTASLALKELFMDKNKK